MHFQSKGKSQSGNSMGLTKVGKKSAFSMLERKLDGSDQRLKDNAAFWLHGRYREFRMEMLDDLMKCWRKPGRSFSLLFLSLTNPISLFETRFAAWTCILNARSYWKPVMLQGYSSSFLCIKRTQKNGLMPILGSQGATWAASIFYGDTSNFHFFATCLLLGQPVTFSIGCRAMGLVCPVMF